MRGVLVVCVVAMGCLLPASALAGVTSPRDGTGDVRARGLTPADLAGAGVDAATLNCQQLKGLRAELVTRRAA